NLPPYGGLDLQGDQAFIHTYVHPPCNSVENRTRDLDELAESRELTVGRPCVRPVTRHDRFRDAGYKGMSKNFALLIHDLHILDSLDLFELVNQRLQCGHIAGEDNVYARVSNSLSNCPAIGLILVG